MLSVRLPRVLIGCLELLLLKMTIELDLLESQLLRKGTVSRCLLIRGILSIFERQRDHVRIVLVHLIVHQFLLLFCIKCQICL